MESVDNKTQDSGTVKQPTNLVYYKSPKEQYDTLHTCIVLRELPELTPEELRQIAERDRSLGLDGEGEGETPTVIPKNSGR